MSIGTGHKPVGNSQNVSFRHHHEPELLIEMNVRLSVGLKIRACSVGIHMHTERGQQCGSNSLMLNAGFDGHGSQMPVRLSRISVSPYSGPVQNAERRAEWIAKHDSGQHAKFFKGSRLTKAGACHATDPHKRTVAISAINQPPLVKTDQYGQEEPFQRPVAAVNVRYCEGPDVQGIIAHGSAKDLCCCSKVDSSKFAQCYQAGGSHQKLTKLS